MVSEFQSYLELKGGSIHVPLLLCQVLVNAPSLSRGEMRSECQERKEVHGASTEALILVVLVGPDSTRNSEVISKSDVDVTQYFCEQAGSQLKACTKTRFTIDCLLPGVGQQELRLRDRFSIGQSEHTMPAQSSGKMLPSCKIHPIILVFVFSVPKAARESVVIPRNLILQ